MYLGYTNREIQNGHTVFRNDINSFWQQRTIGNNVLKVSFDIFTQEANEAVGQFYLENNDTPKLFYLSYNSKTEMIIAALPFVRGNSANTTYLLKYSNGSYVTLPKNTWVTIEVYIDYNNSTITVSLPTMNNYTTTYNMPYSLQLGGTDADGNPLPDDSPVKFMFLGNGGISTDPALNNPFRLRVDNINFVAQNSVPAINLGVNEQLTQSFNLYPNPATNIVNITNSENINVEQVVVYDVTGKQLSTQTFNNEAEIQLNVENLASGTYMLHLHTKDGVGVKKIMKK